MPSDTLPKTTFFLIFRGKTLLLVREKENAVWEHPKATTLQGPIKLQLETMLQKHFAQIEISDPKEVSKDQLKDAENIFREDGVFYADTKGSVRVHKMTLNWFVGKDFLGATLSAEAFAALHSSYVQKRIN